MRGEKEDHRRNMNKACLDCSDLVVQFMSNQFISGRDQVVMLENFIV